MSKTSKKDAVSTDAAKAEDAVEKITAEQFEALKAENTDLKRTLKDMTEACDGAEAMVIAKNNDLSDALAENTKFKAEISTLESQVSTLKEDVEILRTALAAAREGLEKGNDAASSLKDGEIKIASRSADGFRRAGKKFSPTATPYKLSDFTDEELKAIEREPNLVVVHA